MYALSLSSPLHKLRPCLLVFNVAFVRALQDHISPSTPLIINNVDPGFCITSLRRNVDPSIFVELDKTARTSEEGSRQLIWASVGPDPKQLDSAEVTNVMRGAWAGPCLALTDPHPVFKTEAGAALQQRLWVSFLSAYRAAELELII